MNIKHIGMTAYTQGQSKLTIIVDGDRAAIAEQVMAANEDPDDKPYELVIKKVRKGRSLDANAYAWVLIDKLAQKLGMAKSDVYRELIRDIGGVSQIFCMLDNAVETFTRIWTSQGSGWQVETAPSKIPGCTTVTAYFGSSVYDTRQMSALIDRIISECRLYGIETMTPDQLSQLKEAYNANYDRNSTKN